MLTWVDRFLDAPPATQAAIWLLTRDRDGLAAPSFVRPLPKGWWARTATSLMLAQSGVNPVTGARR